MDTLKSLGVDITLWYQLASFLVCYFALSNLVFKPYLRAFHEREKRTVGNEEAAIRIINETQGLESDYEQKARAINTSIKAVYDQTRLDAQRDYERVARDAREQSNKLLDQARAKIITEVEAARKAIAAEVPTVSSVIATKLAGKDLSI